jgi:hypothetical protein
LLLEMLEEVAAVDMIINLQSSGWHFKSQLLCLDVLILSAGVIHNSLWYQNCHILNNTTEWYCFTFPWISFWWYKF